MSSSPAVPTGGMLHAVDLYQTVEYTRRQVQRAGPALPALLLATAGLALGVSLLRRALPERLHPWIGLGLTAWQMLSAMHAAPPQYRGSEFDS